jgi:hypothetical protein
MEPEVFCGVESVRVHRLDSRRYEIHYDRTAVTPLAVMQRIIERTRVTDFTLKAADLEELICRLYESGKYGPVSRGEGPAQ